MCFYVNVNIEKEKLKNNLNFVKNINSRFNKDSSNLNEVSAFTFPDIPILTFQQEEYEISDYNWGLIPDWVNPNEINEFRKNTLNARIETIDEKISFKKYTQQKGVLTLNGFYEWQHIGKHKNKYYIKSYSFSSFLQKLCVSLFIPRNMKNKCEAPIFNAGDIRLIKIFKPCIFQC